MITVSFLLRGSHIVRDFDSIQSWYDYCDSVNPEDSPYILETLSIKNNETPS